MPPKDHPSSSTSRLRSVTGSALAVLLSLACLGGPSSEAQSLIGSRSALVKAGHQARQHGYTYLRTGSQVREFVDRGLLVRLAGDSNYRVNSVSYPYARPEVKLFVERLSRQYRSACGEKLVVTSLTRPLSRQPANASHLSVHPTGMAMDLRRSSRASCRKWLESTLLTLEGRGVLEATKENHPPHYHVSLFPRKYTTYLASRGALPRGAGSGTVLADAKSYRVRGGDSLWEIARRHGTSVSQIKRANGISSNRLMPGQMLQIPAR